MIYRILTLTFLLASGLGFAQDFSYAMDNEVLDKIEANKNICVAGYTENRVYLHSDRIVPTPQGMYLKLNDNDSIFLPTVNSDSYGCYVPCVQVFNICPGCNREYFLSCNNPDCPLVKRKEDRSREREREKERGKEDRRREKERKKK